MSIRLKKQRQLVAALLKRDLTRVKTLSALRPLSPVSLDHALIGVEEWVAQLEGTLRGCFEDERVSVDVTERVNKTIANFRDPDELEPNPGPAYRSVIAQLLGVNGRVEKLIKDLGLYVEPKGLPPLRPEEASLVNVYFFRSLTEAMSGGGASPARSGRRPAPAREPDPPPRATTTARQVFISHSALDEELAGRLVGLLTAALDPPLARGDIMCTSVAGCTLEGGADTDVRLLAEIKAAPAFIGLVTGPSVASGYVLFELGARWASGGPLTIPVLGPASGFDMLPGPWKSVNALRTDKRDRVLQLVHEIAHALGRTVQPPHAWDHAVTALVETRGAEPEPDRARQPRLAPIDWVIDGGDLQRLAECAFSYRAILGQVNRERDSRVVDAAIQLGELDLSLLKKREAVKAQVQAIFDKAQSLHPDIEVHVAKIERDTKHDCNSLMFDTMVAGAPRETRLDFDYLSGPEWGELAVLHAALAEVGPGPFRVETRDGEYEARNVFEAVKVLETRGVFVDPLS